MRALLAGAALAGASLFCASGARAQATPTWEGERASPALGEVLVVDATGEDSWPFGAEDVADDGAAFLDAEAAVDVRSVYVARGNGQLWVRLYVSADTEPPPELVAYVFVDTDQDPGTGGPAVATDLAPALATDPSNGGYEFLVVVPADGTAPALWEWGGADWVTATTAANALLAETGVDRDPLLLVSNQHGYVQVTVDYGVTDLNATCAADLFFRTAAPGAVASDGDLVVGEATRCTPLDTDGTRIPDVIEPPDCTNDDDCAGDGICVGGRCRIPVSCLTDPDCAGDETCTDGACVAGPGGTCNDDADCEPLVCDGGTCGPCAADADCTDGRCAPDGTCVPTDPGSGGTGGTAGTGGATGSGGTLGAAGAEELTLEPGEEVRGGACACTLPGRPASGGAGLFALTALAALATRRRRTPI